MKPTVPDMSQVQLAGGGVERGEQLVCGIGAGIHQAVENAGLACIGVTDQRDIEGVVPVALATLGLALALDLVQTLLGALDAFADHAAVQFDLGFTGAATGADAAALSFQVRPAAHQPGTEVLQPGQFHLQLTLVAPCPLGEYLQDQQGAVVDRQLHVTFQVALLGRAEALVEQYFARSDVGGEHFDLVGLAAAHEQRGVWRLALAGDSGGRFQTRRLRQQAEFFQPTVEIRRTNSMWLVNLVGDTPSAMPARQRWSGGCSLATFGDGEVHGAARDDGGNRVFVDHLGHGVAQQHDILVEGLDLSLQLDTVDEVDRYRHVLPTQGVEERILQ